MIFLVFLVLVISFSYLGDEKVSGERNATFFRIALILILSYLPGMGGDLYEDHQSYLTMFKNIDKFNFSDIDDLETFLGKSESGGERAESCFLLFCKLLYMIGLSEVGIFLVLAIITNTLLVKTYYRFEFPVLIFLIFICSANYFQEANLVRQMLAISILIYSTNYIVYRKWGKYLLCCLLAYLIHRSSIMMAPFVLLCFDNKSYKYLRFIFMGLWGLSVLIALKFIIIDMSLLLVIDVLSDMYGMYITNDDTIGIDNLKFNFLFNGLVLLLFFLYKDNQEKNVYAYLFILGIIFFNISVQVPNFSRISLIFTIVNPVFVPYIITLFAKINKKFELQKILVVFVGFYYVTIFYRVLLLESNYIGKNLHGFSEIFRW